MKRLVEFLKATTLGGLFVVLPVAVILGVAAKAVYATHAAVESILLAVIGREFHFPIVLALVLVLAVAFGFGLLLVSGMGRRQGESIEQRVLFRIPGYAAVRAIIGGLTNMNRDGVVKPGLLTISEGIECFVLVTEDHGDGHLTVFIPTSPNPGNGNVQIVQKGMVRLLNVPITDVVTALQQWGFDSQKVLAKDRSHSAVLSPDPTQQTCRTPSFAAQSQPEYP